MKIVEEPAIGYENKLIEIKSAKYVGDFAVKILFNDSRDRVVEFKPFLEASYHPSIRKYLDESKFQQFEIINGNLNWNDYDLIFPVNDLYEGKL